MTWRVDASTATGLSSFTFPDRESAERFAEKTTAASGANRAVAYDDPEPLEPFGESA